MKSSELSRKVTDFIKLEDGNIGRKAAVVTGALLASTVLGSVLTMPVVAQGHCDEYHSWPCHSNTPIHSDGYNCHDYWHINHYQDCPY